MFKAIKVTLLVLVALVLLVLFIVFETKPLVAVNSATQVEDAQSVTQLLSDLNHVIKRDRAYHELILTTGQVNSLLGFLQRAHQPFAGAFYTEGDAGRLMLTYQLKLFGLQRYVNFNMSLSPGERVQISDVSLGKLPLHGQSLIKLARWGVNIYTQSAVADIAYNTVQDVTYVDQEVRLVLAPTLPLLTELKLVQSRFSVEKPELLDVKIAHYLTFLLDNHAVIATPDNSLAPYIREVFLEAQIQSESSDPIIENKAATLAIAIFFGNTRFGRFFNIPNISIYRVGQNKQVTLNGRRDLALHFLYSASIELISERSVSVAVGEFKELMDRAEQGSGYSFVDLAADKAGIAFAVTATHFKTASNFQSLLAQKADESLYLPALDDLPEGLKIDAFNARFESVDSPEYQAKFELIERRISALPISQL